MSVAERRRQDVETSLNNLTLSTPSHKKKLPSKQKPVPIVDSWDEDDASSDTETESSPRPSGNDYPSAPPPTPMSPTSGTARAGWGEFENPYAPVKGTGGTVSPTRPKVRPEKQTAVAGRLIAGALGVRTPKKTDEQKQYDKAMKENEVKRREKERDTKRREEEELQKAKAAVWDD